MFRKNFRFCNVSSIKESVGTDFQMTCAILSFFQHFLKESQNFKLKYSFGKPPGGLLGFRFEKKQYHMSLEKIIPVSQLEKFMFCNVSFIRVRYGTDFQKCHICLFFSKIQRFQNLCVYKYLFCSKKDNGIILFSSETCDIAFFKSETQEASRRLSEAVY